MASFKIALVQLEIALGQPGENLSRLHAQLAEANRGGAQMALLPELWSTGYDLERASELASEPNSSTFAEMSQLARDFSLYLCGSVLESSGGRYFNTQVLYSPHGDLLAAYRKIHLFGLMREPEFLTPGTKPVVADLPWGKAGLSICYDLRFAEIFRTYAFQGAQLILLSAEWPHPRLSHWRSLLIARAIENQSFVAACNTVGAGNENVFCGHSMIIDPWGEVLVEADEAPAVVFAEIDLEQADDIRRRFPFLADARRIGTPELVH